MKGRLHYIAALLLLIHATSFLVPASLLVQKICVAHEMQENLELSELETLSVQKTEVRWNVGSTECIINGRYFDVRSAIEKNNIWILQGLFDDKETEIGNRIAASSMPLEEERASLIYKFIQFAFEDLPVTAPSKDHSLRQLHLGQFEIFYPEDPYFLVSSPPPKV